MQTITFKGPQSIPSYVETFLGFTPSDSLVVLGIGGGPSARVDVEETTVWHVVQALHPCLEHWQDRGVMVAVYSDDVELAEVRAAFGFILPGVDVHMLVTVDEHDVVTDHEGVEYHPRRDADLPSKTVRPSREALVADAERIIDPAAALSTAISAYFEGDGAKAWVYLDRFNVLDGGSADSKPLILQRLLTNAVNPKSDGARALLG